MTIEVTTNEFNPEIREMYRNNELVSFSIDYMFNAVMAWCDGVEYKVIDFNKYFRLDNRFNTYQLETHSDKIVIDIR